MVRLLNQRLVDLPPQVSIRRQEMRRLTTARMKTFQTASATVMATFSIALEAAEARPWRTSVDATRLLPMLTAAAKIYRISMAAVAESP